MEAWAKSPVLLHNFAMAAHLLNSCRGQIPVTLPPMVFTNNSNHGVPRIEIEL
jgi:hypothetical protein